ncbi:LysR family transcriptional regulator [Burkholderia sp. ABCPW 11]|uniref:LysR family transcriptional regulator n=1 Tax=Burkholderia sp. ABCPW 11 TaxID=1637859 RepID=UPI0007571599|nr:LysR family transcriptional regulator [Burkholderia sp. ABCPW 11]KVD46823.1 LysR family transcriptional regulator [Burkholderia sp. ABCPW 11]
MDRITAAEVFLETVARGSISSAAVCLGMSRAMAARYVAQMEEWADSRLLHRTTRKLSLTATGEEVLEICKEILALARDVSVVGAQTGDAPKGLLRVTASSIFAEYCLTDALMAFLQRHRAITVDLQVVDRQTNLAEDGIDLAVRVTNALDPNLIARKLGEVRSVVCASPAYLAAYGTPVHVRDLTAHNCLTYSHYGRSLWHFKADGESIDVPVSGNFVTNEASLVVRAALRGAGVALLPRFAVEQALHDSLLIELTPDFEVEPLGVFAVYLSRHRMPSSLRTLIDFLAENLDLPTGSR